MHHPSVTLGQCAAPAAALLRRHVPRRNTFISRPVVCSAIPADNVSPSTSQSDVDQTAATPRLEAVLHRITSAKAKRALKLEGATKLQRYIA